MKKLIFTYLIFFVITTLGYTQNNSINLNNKGSDINSEMSVSEKSLITNFNSAIRAREIVFNNQLKTITPQQIGSELVIQLFNDKIYTSVIEKVTTNINGTIAINAKLSNFQYAYCIITIHENNIFMNIDIPELNEKYITRINPLTETTYILQLDNSNLDYLEGGAPLTLNISEDKSTKQAIEESSTFEQKSSSKNIKIGSNDPAIIDVMIVYTPAAAVWASSNEGSINNTISAAMDAANLASTNSGLGITYNLIYSGPVTYTEIDPSTDLAALRNGSDGEMDDAITARNANSADMVVLFEETEATGGLGYLLQNRYGNGDLAFCLNRVQQVSWTYTMIHEMGHNMGASHHAEQNFQAGPTDWGTTWPENTWSAGWRWTGNDAGHYCDLMTYEAGSYFADGITHTRIGYFSSPNFTYQGQPTGDAVLGDNARTLKEVKHYVAQYKDANTLLYCAAGTNNYGYTSLTNVTIGSINQASSYSTYSDFSFNTTDVTPGIDHQLTITKSSTSSYEVIVWVDWNNDKDFIDNGEEVYKSGALSPVTFITNINPPLGTSAGNKRMRIRIHNTTTGPNITPCGNADRGEVEDYSINVLPTVSTYNVTFNVSNGTSPIENATVILDGTTQYTNSSGITIFTGKTDNTYAYSVTKSGYQDDNGNLTVNGSNVTKNVTLSQSVYNVTFNVNDGTSPIENATVILDGITQYTNSSGITIFTGKTNNTYSYSVIKTGFVTENGNVTVNGNHLVKNVTLEVVPPTYNVTFNVNDGTNPIDGASVVFDGVTQSTNISGQTIFTNKNNGTYNYSITKTGFTATSGSVTVASANTIENITMNIAPTSYDVTFNVSDGTNPISGASVTIQNITQTTDASGITVFTNIPVGNGHAYNVICPGYFDINSTVDVVNQNISEDVTMTFGLPTSKLRTEYCGFTTTNWDSYILCDRVAGDQAFEFEFSSSAIGYYQIYSTTSSYWLCYLKQVPNIQRGYTYNVRVRAKVDNVWGAWGEVCQVTLNYPTTKLRTEYCGITTSDWNISLLCDRVIGDQAYEFEFSNSSIGYNQIYSNTSASYWLCYLKQVTGIQRGYTYDVRVRAKVADSWGPWGDVCQVTLNYPTTKLRTAYCGYTTNNINNYVLCDRVIGDQAFEFEFSNSTLGYTQIYSNTTTSYWLCRFNQVPGLQKGYTYDVRVRAKVANNWGPWGDICQVTLTLAKTNSLVDENITNLYSDIKLYPIPVKNVLNIEVNTNIEGKYLLEITDITGRLILNEEGYIEETTYLRQKDLSDLGKGVYFVKVYFGSEWTVKKFIKE